MYYFLTKWLPLFLLPPGSFFILMLVAVWLWYKGRSRIARYVLIIGIVWLYIASNPWMANIGVNYWESSIEAKRADTSLPATVVLGGMFDQYSQKKTGQPYQILDAADRILHGIRLMESRASQYLILSGGKNPLTEGPDPEAEIMASFIRDHSHLPDSVYFKETKSVNTEENALYSRELIESKDLPEKIYLVTSALHMPRAVKIFREAGFEVYPQPTDFQQISENATFSLIGLMPNASALKYTAKVMREMMGYYFYCIKYDLWHSTSLK